MTIVQSNPRCPGTSNAKKIYVETEDFDNNLSFLPDEDVSVQDVFTGMDESFVPTNPAIDLNSTHRIGDGSDHSVVQTNAVKLATIEEGAEVNPNDAEVKTAYENNTDTNAFTDDEKTNLGNQSNTNTGDQDITGIATNTADITTNADKIATNSQDIGTNATDITELQGAYSYFPIWAEDSAALTVGHTWSFGNGCETPAGSGIVLPVDCELYAITADVPDGTGIKIAVAYRSPSGTNLGDLADTGTFSTNVNNVLSAAVTAEAGNIINFYTLAVTTGGTSGRVCAWFRVPII